VSPKQNTTITEICQERLQVNFCGETALAAQHERSIS
jgi:hypothetical protein